MTLHPQAAEFLSMLAQFGPPSSEPPPTETSSIRQMRAGLSRGYGFAADRLELPEVRDLTIPGTKGHAIPVRRYRPKDPGEAGQPTLIYFHGGGWVLGDIDAVDGTCRRLAASVGCTVVNVGYRLAPEHPFPAAVEDAWAVTAHLAEHAERHAVDPRAIAVSGDSAGGALAAVVAQQAAAEGLDLAHQLLINPATDTAMDTRSYAEYGDGYALQAASMAWSLDLYAGDADRADPRMAPLRAPSFQGLAPATIITAEYDVLRDEAETYAQRLGRDGVPVEMRRYDGMVHAFFLYPEIFDAAVEAEEWAAARLRAAFATATGTAASAEGSSASPSTSASVATSGFAASTGTAPAVSEGSGASPATGASAGAGGFGGSAAAGASAAVEGSDVSGPDDAAGAAERSEEGNAA